ncbi:hypothetical protein KH990_10025 [Methanoculleus bourgensis]|uniref:hypothetical protein n=1 Tax=Methanoculleus bourgensis TaxID=83986 RepID=UPI001BD92686|nr:hypothetical protein [Methanoculleus bourgensis]MBT0733697.1 hypothetical protein [Methanoculleus bourgensis]
MGEGVLPYPEDLMAANPGEADGLEGTGNNPWAADRNVRSFKEFREELIIAIF